MGADALQAIYDDCKQQARKLAGRPGDITQRVMVHHQLYRASFGNHVFPLVALHGALWAYGFFETTGKLGDLIGLRYFYDEEEKKTRMKMLDGFAEGFKAINREVFVDTFTNFHFSWRCGETAGAEAFLHPELLDALNEAHRATRKQESLSEERKKHLFTKALHFEQECTVAPGIARELERFDCPILRALCLMPIVRFSYFPAWRHFYFRDFSDKEERIRRAMHSYQIAESQGWDRVEASMQDYAVLPTAYFDKPEAHAQELFAAASIA